MNAQVLQAYEALVPADQLVIDAAIITLYKKDVEIRKLVQDVMARQKAQGDSHEK